MAVVFAIVFEQVRLASPPFKVRKNWGYIQF